jgi:methylenetetrahydrofolate reductase (NADPH)
MAATGPPASAAEPVADSLNADSLNADSLSADRLKQRIMAFVHNASLEITPADEKRLPQLAALLPTATTMYIAHPPNTTLNHVVKTALAVQRAGFTAAPHIVARRINYPQTLRTTLADLRQGGVDRLLLVAGDGSQVAGEFASTLDVLDSRLLEESGMTQVDVAGYPEGQKSVGTSLLWDALSAKQAYAARTGMKMHIVTQFGLNGKAVAAWESELVRRNIVLPVHAGIAGPVPLSKLIHFAMVCGIGASLRTVLHNLSAASGVTELAISPDRHVMHLMELPAATQVVAPHFFSFGAALETARWMHQVSLGKFELDLGAHKFAVLSNPGAE